LTDSLGIQETVYVLLYHNDNITSNHLLPRDSIIIFAVWTGLVWEPLASRHVIMSGDQPQIGETEKRPSGYRLQLADTDCDGLNNTGQSTWQCPLGMPLYKLFISSIFMRIALSYVVRRLPATRCSCVLYKIITKSNINRCAVCCSTPMYSVWCTEVCCSKQHTSVHHTAHRCAVCYSTPMCCVMYRDVLFASTPLYSV